MYWQSRMGPTPLVSDNCGQLKLHYQVTWKSIHRPLMCAVADTSVAVNATVIQKEVHRT